MNLFSKKILHQKVREFAEALMKDLSLRHQKHEDPAYVLEPNIKEGQRGIKRLPDRSMGHPGKI